MTEKKEKTLQEEWEEIRNSIFAMGWIAGLITSVIIAWLFGW